MAILSPLETSHALAGLKEKLGDRLFLADEARQPFKSDFGRMVNRLPGAVARCTSAEEVAEVVRYCRQTGLPIVARGQGHTQSGQATTLGGVLVDTSAMQRIHEIDAVGLTATCDGGVIWRQLVAATVPMGLVPP